MKISIINGSPKPEKSTSELMIQYFQPLLGESKTTVYNICKMDLSEMQLTEIQDSDALIFVFPLYVDSIPSHLLRFLIQLEKQGLSRCPSSGDIGAQRLYYRRGQGICGSVPFKLANKPEAANRNASVYCIINNGFYEGKQTYVASSLMKNWCKAAGLTWGQTVGIGAGEMLPFLKDIPLGHGPNKNIGKAFRELACNVLSLNAGNDLFLSPNWPRFLWKIESSLDFWYPRARKNGVTRKRLKEKYMDD